MEAKVKTPAAPRLALLLPGPETMLAAAREVDPDAGWFPGGKELAVAFSFSPLSADERASVAAAAGAVLVQLSCDLREGRAEVQRAVERLVSAGAVAVRVEQSKLGHGAARWLDLLRSDNPFEQVNHATVLLEEEGRLASCGMHAFSLPDVEIEAGEGALALLRTFNAWQLAEAPLLFSGETFSLEASEPRRVLERWPDTRYPRGDWPYNPYGIWRIGPPGGKGRPQPKLRPVYVLPLWVPLSALERQKGAPLTRAEVEKVRDEAPCIALEPKRAIAFERARGYADLDPELAWEQWQLVRDPVGSPAR